MKPRLAVPGTFLAVSLLIPGSAAVATHGEVDPGIRCRGNGFYTVCVDVSNQIGRFTARTAELHPVPNRSMLYGSELDWPWSSFWTIRSFTSGTDYVSLGTYGHAFDAEDLAQGATWHETPTGIQSRHLTAGPDQLEVTQTAEAVGSGYSESAVELRTSVRNAGSSPVTLGLRHVIDVQIGLDDGPSFRRRSPADASWLVREEHFVDPSFGYWETRDNDMEDPGSPLYAVFGSLTGPRDRGITAPSEMAFACWDAVVTTAFDFDTAQRNVSDDGNRECTRKRSGDSAIVYWFGKSAHRAPTLEPGETMEVRIQLAAAPIEPLAQPPFCHEDGLRVVGGENVAGLASETVADVVEPIADAVPVAGAQARALIHEVNCDIVVPIEDEVEWIASHANGPAGEVLP